MQSSIRPAAFVLFVIFGIGSGAHAQIRVQRPTPGGPPAEDSTRVTLALDVGNRHFDQAKQGRCVYAPQASIYNTLASMWSVEVEPAAGSTITLTVWRPTRGDTMPQITFGVSTGNKTQRIATVKATKTAGTGTVQLTKNGAGGRFELRGTTAEGAEVRGSIACDKFAAPMAVGGN